VNPPFPPAAPTSPLAPPPAAPSNAFRVLGWIFLLAVIFSLPALRGSGRSTNYLAGFWDFLTRFFPPDFSEAHLLGLALWQTGQIAVLATLFAIVLSLPISLAAAQNLAPRPIVAMARAVLSLIRSIPSLVWAVVAVAVVGANSLAGVVALTFYSIGYLGKFFSDAIESVDREAAAALRAHGASAIQVWQYAVWPQTKPFFFSHSLWMLEYNLRSAAIIGYVGAGGIGVYLHTYQEFGQWQKFCAVLCGILALVLVLDWVGQRLRRVHARERGLH
jgi:phosphonate transport system permease protein